jgi:hypothetical protein
MASTVLLTSPAVVSSLSPRSRVGSYTLLHPVIHNLRGVLKWLGIRCEKSFIAFAHGAIQDTEHT